MQSSIETWLGDDDLSRQRRKREARMLDGEVPDFPGLTVADVVADVLAASNEGDAAFDVPDYLVERGHTSMTIKTVVESSNATGRPFEPPWSNALESALLSSTRHRPGLRPSGARTARRPNLERREPARYRCSSGLIGSPVGKGRAR